MTTADTLTAARNGDTDALADLYVESFPAAVLIARREGARDPEDVAAQVLADVLDLVRDGRGPTDSFAGYVRLSVKREAWRRVKADRRLRPLPEWLPQYAAPEPDEFDPDLIRAAFAELSDSHRWVLQLVDVEGIKPAEIAARTNLSPNAVSALVYRARTNLRRAYNAAADERNEP